MKWLFHRFAEMGRALYSYDMRIQPALCSLFIFFSMGMSCPPQLSGDKELKPEFAPDSIFDGGPVVGAKQEIEIQFYVLIHAGEGNPVDCDFHEAALKSCYGEVFSSAPQSPVAAYETACTELEVALEHCELAQKEEGGIWVNDPVKDKNCRLENYDPGLDRSHPAYNHRLHVRYKHCRDELIRVLDGFADIGVSATIQFRGGLFESLVWEEVNEGPFSFQSHVVDNGHEISFHHHFECEVSTSTACIYNSPGTPLVNVQGHTWGDAFATVDDKHNPSTQAMADTRLDSLLLMLDYAENLSGGYFHTNRSSNQINSVCGWGNAYRLKEDMKMAAETGARIEEMPQFKKLSDNGFAITTSANEFQIDIESPCHDGSATGINENRRAVPHPIQLTDDLWFYPSPGNQWGQPPKATDDPNLDEEIFGDYLQCIEARLGASNDSSDSIVRYNGQTFVWGGTTHLHNLIEDDASILDGALPDSAVYPAGVVALARYKALLEELISEHNANSDHQGSVSVNYTTVGAAHAKRSEAADHGFQVLLEP